MPAPVVIAAAASASHDGPDAVPRSDAAGTGASAAAHGTDAADVAAYATDAAPGAAGALGADAARSTSEWWERKAVTAINHERIR